MMAGALGLVSKLPCDVLETICKADWAQEKGREHSCSLVESFLSQDAEFKQLVGQLSQVQGSPLQKYGPTAEDWKKKGNEAFKIGAWEKAVECYTKALQYAPHDQAGRNLAALFSNRAAALEKQGESTAVVTDCSRAIEADAQFGKAWYRRGKAKAALQDCHGAVRDLEVALQIENGDFMSRAAVGSPLSGAETTQKAEAHYEAKEGAKKPVRASANAQQIETELERVRGLVSSDKPEGAQNAEASRIQDVSNQSIRNLQADNSTRELNGSVESTFVLNGAEVFHQQGKGRGLRACKALKPGEVLIREQPFAAVLLKANRTTHCHHCFAALPPNPLPCKGCAGPLFCTEACRDAALGQCTVGLNFVRQPLSRSSASEEASNKAQSQTSKLELPSVKQTEDASTDNVSSQREIKREGAGFFGWHQHECEGASWPAILPPDMVLAVRSLARLQSHQASSEEGPSLASQGSQKGHRQAARTVILVTSLCHHLDRVPKEERPTLLVQACIAARCSQSACFMATPADVLLMIGRLRANAMAVNEVMWRDERPQMENESPFVKHETSIGHQANGEIQERADHRSLSTAFETGTLGKGSKTQSQALDTQEEGQRSYAAEVSNLTFTQTQLGQALYPHGGLLNHSCDPNAAVSFEGTRLTVRAVKAVSTGSELTLSYGPQKGETRTAKRRKWLWERYAFLCNCTACSGDQTSDVLITGLKCPTANCFGVVPLHTATGSFSFAALRAPEADVAISSTSRAAESSALDTNGRSEGVVSCSVKLEVCSDCRVDQADVACDECGGRKLCLECDSHVHQPKSKRRAGHVRRKIEEETDDQGLVQIVAALSIQEEGSNSFVKGKGAQTSNLTTNSITGTSQASDRDESGIEGRIGQQPLNGQSKKCRAADEETRTSEDSATSKNSEGVCDASGARKHAIERRQAIPSKSQAPSTKTLSRVERGRCPVCGANVDVSEAERRLAAAWEGIKGSMPFLEAAERALHASRGILHPLNRKVAEYDDQLAEAHAQAGRCEEALDHCGRSLKILEHHYPRGSLPLGHEYAKLASIARAAGKTEAADEAATKAAKIFIAHYGQAF